MSRAPFDAQPARLMAGALAAAAPLLAQAQAAASTAATGPSLGPLVFALLLVLALIPLALWLLKRIGPMQVATQAAGLKVIAQLPLGPRERVVVLEAGDRWLLLGVTAASVQRIGTLPKGALPAAPSASAFAALLSKVQK